MSIHKSGRPVLHNLPPSYSHPKKKKLAAKMLVNEKNLFLRQKKNNNSFRVIKDNVRTEKVLNIQAYKSL